MRSQWKTWPWRGTTLLEKTPFTTKEINHLTHSYSMQVSKMGNREAWFRATALPRRRHAEAGSELEEYFASALPARLAQTVQHVFGGPVGSGRCRV